MRRSAALVVVALSIAAGRVVAQAPVTAGEWTPAALRADVAQLRRHVAEREKSYTAAARQQALARVDELEKAVDTISPVAFELEVGRIIALADNGHTNVSAPIRSIRYNHVGLHLVTFGTQLYVLRTREANADLLGAKLRSIDGHDIEEIRREEHALQGGAPNFRDRFLPNFAESPDQLHAARLTARPDRAVYRFELPDGRVVEREFVAEPMLDFSVQRVPPWRWMYPDSLVTDGTPWRGVLDPAKAPWSLQQSSARFRFRRAPELDAVVVELRQNMPSPGYDLGTFIATVRDSIRAITPRNVVLDMRMNGGGNLNLTRDFVQDLPKLVPGRVFALTSPSTFSAAISTVAYLKQAAPDRVSIVGEMVGDRLEFWAEGRPIALENTGIRISMATERHDYANGCRAYRDCHGSVVRYPISVTSLEPDLPAPWTMEAYRAGRDPGMEAIARALGRFVP